MTSKGLIRAATLSDAARIQEIYAPYVTDTIITFDLIPPSHAEMKQRMTEILPRYPWYVYEEAKMVHGYAYACQHRTREAYRWSVDVGIYVRQGFARKGIGRRLYQALIKDLKELGFANAFAGITQPNAASVGFHESMGFKPIGIYQKVGYKLGAWHDVGWWQLFLSHPDQPHEPQRPKISTGIN